MTRLLTFVTISIGWVCQKSYEVCSVVVRCVCGYGTERLAVPAPLRQATLLYTQVDYDPVADRAQIERAAEDLMWPFRLAEVG